MKIFKFVIILIIIIISIVSCKGRYAKDTVNAFVTRDNFKNTILALELYKKEFGDAWGREYYYVKLKNDYKIFSLGADGKPFTKDDIYPPKE